MAEELKVGVVFREERPRMFSDLSAEELPWHIEFFDYRALEQATLVPRPDFVAVFFPSCGVSCADIQRSLAGAFPGADLIAYKFGSDMAATRVDGTPVVQVPLESAVADHLLKSLALAKTSQRELIRFRRQEGLLRGLAECAINLMDSSWNVNDRKLGVGLLANKLLAAVRAEECVVYLQNEDGGALQRTFTTGNIRDIDVFDYNINSSVVENVVRTGMPYLNNDDSYELKLPFSQESLLIRSVLCVRLESHADRIGVLELINKIDGGFTDHDQDVLQMFAAPLAAGLRAIEMFERAERLTITDDLTKLYNYRYLMQYLDSEVKRCLRYKKKVSLLFIDVDGFKKINDTFGHLVGSQALAEMGQVFKQILRETDVVGRYGGDEFVIVLPETPLNGAMVIAERIRKKVEDYEFIAQNLSIRLTVSLGVANCPKHTLTPEGLIKKADAAMYRAKELSKNSIRVAV